MAKQTDVIKKVPGWALVPARVDAVIYLAASGRQTHTIAAETGMSVDYVRTVLRKRENQRRIAEIQDGMRAQLTGKSVSVARSALNTLSQALKSAEIPLLQRARLAVKVLEAQSKAQAVAQSAPNITTNVAITAQGLLAQLRAKPVAELSDDELTLVSEAPIMDAQLVPEDEPSADDL